jgi:hypothetical protein
MTRGWLRGDSGGKLPTYPFRSRQWREHVDWRSKLSQHSLLNQLLQFERDINQGRTWAGHGLDDAGLLLRESGVVHTSTPTNVVPFADTGGDGTHYSLLPLPETPPDDWPVVMTVPFQWDFPNTMVGSSLHEFLCLGCYFGYFALEQLAYYNERDLAIAELQVPEDVEDAWPEKRQILALMRSRFELSPWNDVRSRLAELDAQFRHLLVVTD